MRNVNLTAVNVQVNDRLVRTNVVVTLRDELLRLRLCLRHACKAFAKHYGEWQHGSQAMVPAAVSPSLGGLRSSGVPGIALGS
jgi:hypothetical protein